MESHLAAALVTAALVAGAVAPGLAQESPEAARGRELYASERCGACHAVGTEGNRRGPLDDVGRRLSADELRRWLLEPKVMTAQHGSTRRPAMPDYTRLASEEIDALVAYMLTLTGE